MLNNRLLCVRLHRNQGFRLGIWPRKNTETHKNRKNKRTNQSDSRNLNIDSIEIHFTSAIDMIPFCGFVSFRGQISLRILLETIHSTWSNPPRCNLFRRSPTRISGRRSVAPTVAFEALMRTPWSCRGSGLQERVRPERNRGSDSRFPRQESRPSGPSGRFLRADPRTWSVLTCLTRSIPS